jgi:hypothetical protein
MSKPFYRKVVTPETENWLTELSPTMEVTDSHSVRQKSFDSLSYIVHFIYVVICGFILQDLKLKLSQYIRNMSMDFFNSESST